MAWIKRNLYFVIGGAVALILMGLAGFYLYSNWQADNAVMQKLEENFAELQRLNSENPHPGSGNVDNVVEAQNQQKELRTFITSLRKFYQPIERIPSPQEAPKVTDRAFSAALSRTIDQLQRAANNTSVLLPPNYSFSFETQRPRVTFAAGSTEPLAVQLGEVKSIADVLIAAKVNSIDNIRRERVSSDDLTGPQTDYTDAKSETNDLAVLTPYEVTFRCFSTELAGVLGGFAASPHALMVKSLNVEPAAGTNTTMMGPDGMPMPGYAMPPGMPGGMIAPPPTAAEAEYGGRYGRPAMGNAEVPGGRYGPAGGAGPGGGTQSRYGTLGGGALGGGAAAGGVTRGPEAPTMAPPGVRPPVAGYGGGAFTPPARTAGGALPTVLDEKQLKVTMKLLVVKLNPSTPRK